MPTYSSVPKSVSILCIGNSFSQDTVEYTVKLLVALGVEDVKVANMYYGGCSINKHYEFATQDQAVYQYELHSSSGSKTIMGIRISEAIAYEKWDWISIQHGTGDGSRYAEQDSYTNLAALITYIKNLAGADTKIAFNMTWVGERGSHPEMIAFGNKQDEYFDAICDLTANYVANVAGVDRVCPTGTAVQNARSTKIGILTRDNYHLNMKGQYIAGLAFVAALTGIDFSGLDYAPNGVSEEDLQIALAAVRAALDSPYEVTDLA